MAVNMLATPGIISQLIEYDPETGDLFWKYRDSGFFSSDRVMKSWNSRFCGKRALGSLNNSGYYSGAIFGRLYLAHRVAWAIYYGEWPDEDLDHSNNNRRDNRIKNLRNASRLENCRNSSLRKDNRCGLKGVGMHKGRWRARIRVDGRSVHLGYFDTPESAHEAYCIAAKKYHGEFARLS